MQKLEDMNLIDNFLFQEVARNKEYGGEFCRIILETILGREIKEVEIDIEVEKSIPGATLESHGIRLDALVKERDPHRMEVSTGSGAATYFDLEPNNYKISDPAAAGDIIRLSSRQNISGRDWIINTLWIPMSFYPLR